MTNSIDKMITTSTSLRMQSQELARQKAMLALQPETLALYQNYLGFILAHAVNEHLRWCFAAGRTTSVAEKAFPALLRRMVEEKKVSITASDHPVEDGVQNGENGLVVRFEDQSMWLFRYSTPSSPCLLIKGEATSTAQMLFTGIDDPETMFSELNVMGLYDFVLNMDGMTNRTMKMFYQVYIEPLADIQKVAV